MRVNRTKSRGRRRSGFTLLEVMIVVAIIVMLAAFAIPNLIGMQDKAKIDATRVQVKAFEQAVKTYKVKVGDYPGGEGLSALVSGPGGGTEAWTPLMSNEDVNALDQWGNRFQYSFPGSRNPYGSSAPDIWSNGPDRQSGTADDIGNWTTRR
jgi:general secretion pathway protein G